MTFISSCLYNLVVLDYFAVVFATLLVNPFWAKKSLLNGRDEASTINILKYILTETTTKILKGLSKLYTSTLVLIWMNPQ